MRIVSFKNKIFVAKSKNALHFRIKNHSGQRPEIAAKQKIDLIQVVKIDVCIAKSMDKLTGL